METGWSLERAMTVLRGALLELDRAKDRVDGASIERLVQNLEEVVSMVSRRRRFDDERG
jgi:hypothetical protein